VAEVYVEGKRLDVFEGFNFSFNYSIADIRHPEKRSTEYSKTIRCPGTPNNDSIFGQIYDVNISNPYNSGAANVEINFNPNKKAEAVVLADGVPVMRGSLQLRKVRSTYTDFVYDVVFVGQLVGIFGELGDKQLNGLGYDEATQTSLPHIDFSDLNHVYNQANQTASWTAPFGSGYVYPMIDYGRNFTYTPQGWRYYWVEDFRPAMYAKDIVDRIFAFAGFSYSSSFLSSAFFKRLIVPCGQALRLTEDQATARSFKAVKNLDQVMHRLETVHPSTFGNEMYFANWGAMVKLCFEDDSVNGFDNNNQYRILSTPNQLYGNQTENNYIFVSTQPQRTDILKSSVNLRVQKNTASVTREVYKGVLRIMRENSQTGVNSVVAETAWSFDLEALSVGEHITKTFYVEGEVTMFDNDNCYVMLDSDPQDDGFTADFRNQIGGEAWLDFRCTGGYFMNEPVVDAFYDGDTLQMQQIVPEVGMADFLISIFNMFNLFVWSDPNQENNLRIETRDDFYEGGIIRDWSKKLDHSKEISLEPLALLTANEYEYTYSEDSDYYNERYQDAHGHTYGRARIDVDNDFLRNTNTTSVIFSPTPLVNDNPSNRIIGKIYDSDIDEGAQPTDANIRILYYAGLLDSDPKWQHASLIDGSNYPLQYPYAGHLTHPTAPSQDINFGIPAELFYAANSYTGTLLYTNDNLFNRYHRRGMLEATNKDSKLMTAYFYLTPLDIQKLDFRDQILIDNSFWRLNKVMNYNPFGNDLTKVELIKIITKEPLKMETFTVGSNGTTPDAGGVVKRPRLEKTFKNNNQAPIYGGVVKGRNNTIADGVTSFMVRGDGNEVGVGCANITITGDNNTVNPSLRNVTIINSNGVTATRSNQSFMNNRQQESSEVLEGGEDEVRALDGGTNIFTVDGGEDIVQAQFSESSIYIVNGN
jgi:hypothetical protein